MKNMKHPVLKPIDFVPAISGLIGKIALASSFAFVWGQELGITKDNFVFENVRIEILIGSMITILGAMFVPNASPPGTLAPLIVLVPAMAAFGAHPLVLGLLVGIIGIIVVKMGLFSKLVKLSGFVSKTSLTLAFGISGLILSAEKLKAFFGDNHATFYTLLFILGISYVILLRKNMAWLAIPLAAVVSLILPNLFGMSMDTSINAEKLHLNPSYWWNDLWGIGFGIEIGTILRTLPFALFIILLWTIDTLSIQTLQEVSGDSSGKKQEIDINTSFIIASIRNIVGAGFGGAQTSSLWRSFLIPLFMVKRPMRPCAILLGVLGIISSITVVPIKVMSFTPLIWSVLLFGIFMPFTVTAILNIQKTEKFLVKGAVILFSVPGIFINPILTWIASVIFERVYQKKQKVN